MMNAPDHTEERDTMTDAVLDIVCRDGPIVGNELAIRVLVDALAVFVAGAAKEKPPSIIDHVAVIIGRMIADGAHLLHGEQDEMIH